MENSLKQRIVGAVVLIALAVIFLPAILKEKEQQEPFISKIPAKPIESLPKELPEEVIEKNKKVQQSLDQLEVQEIKQKLNDSNAIENDIKETAESKVETEVKNEIINQDSVEKTTKTIGTNFQDAAWIIQIASFSNKDNAVSFVEKLKTAGHKTYRQDIKNDQNKMIYRVYTGPYIRKEDAEKALKKVNQDSKLSGIIMLFDPTKQ